MKKPTAALKPEHQPGIHFLWILMILGLVLFALLSASPYFFKVPDTDSSIFLYIGARIRAGQLPYLDAYDHKPPLIFYLNALGLILGQGSRWGVWALEFISLAAASLLSLAFLKRYFGRLAAVLVTAVMLLNLAFVLEHGNLTEEFALPFLFATLLLLSKMEDRGKPGWTPFWMGAALGMASTLKQPLAGMGLSVVIYLAVTRLGKRDLRGLALIVAQMALGGLAVWAGWFVYFKAAGIFPEFWDGAFAYNLALSGITLQQRLNGVLNALIWIFTAPNLFLAGLLFWLTLPVYLVLHDRRFRSLLVSRWMGGLLAAAAALMAVRGSYALAVLLLAVSLPFLMGIVERKVFPFLEKRKIEQNSSLFLPLMIAVVDFPVAFLLPNLSGNSYPHYFMTLLPSMCILGAFVVHLLMSAAKSKPDRAAGALWLGVLCLPVLAWGVYQTINLIGPNTNRDVIQAAEAIQGLARPGDTVLEWGNLPAVNLLSGHLAPTRFFFTDPLFVAGYSGKIQAEMLLKDLKRSPPGLILDEKLPYRPLVVTEDRGQCGLLDDPAYIHQVVESRWSEKMGGLANVSPAAALPAIPDGMPAVYRWVCENYEPVQTIGELKWTLYRLRK